DEVLTEQLGEQPRQLARGRDALRAGPPPTVEVVLLERLQLGQRRAEALKRIDPGAEDEPVPGTDLRRGELGAGSRQRSLVQGHPATAQQILEPAHVPDTFKEVGEEAVECLLIEAVQ